ncbi:MAG: PQQ-dependent sugar dehydrogenase [Chthoniobacterales bacterium]
MLCCLAVVIIPCRAQNDGVIVSEKARFKVEVVADGVVHPWGMVKLPDGRLLFTEAGGRLRIIKDGKLQPESIAAPPQLYVDGEGGLLDVELHPDYAKNGWIYLSLTKANDNGMMTAIVRARLDGNQLKDIQAIYDPPASDYTQSYIHCGGRMEFQDGHLFFSIGDRGEPATPSNPAQNLGSARGKIHRVNDDGTIPEDNPFVKTKGALPSIWSYGHRNPQGLRVQPGTDLLWESEHGPHGGDELNVIKKGLNYGWPLVTFGVNDDGTTISDKNTAPGMEDPRLQWTPSIAVSGIDFYNGDQFPAWKGNLFAAALGHQKLVRVELDKDNHITHQEMLLEGSGRIRDVRCFDDGSIYVLYSWPGRVIRLVPAK